MYLGFREAAIIATISSSAFAQKDRVFQAQSGPTTGCQAEAANLMRVEPRAGRSGPSIAGVAEGRPASLREISAELAVRVFINERGNPYSAASINSML